MNLTLTYPPPTPPLITHPTHPPTLTASPSVRSSSVLSPVTSVRAATARHSVDTCVGESRRCSSTTSRAAWVVLRTLGGGGGYNN